MIYKTPQMLIQDATVATRNPWLRPFACVYVGMIIFFSIMEYGQSDVFGFQGPAALPGVLVAVVLIEPVSRTLYPVMIAAIAINSFLWAGVVVLSVAAYGKVRKKLPVEGD